MSIKLDMSKAYDTVEWSFLEDIMRRLGFADQWISLLMACVRSSTYSVLVNGNPLGKIHPTRGLRQGDPLSPYSFLLCVEGLSAMLTRAEIEGRITWVPISFKVTRLSHLFFADDSLLFCRATFSKWGYIHRILQSYERASDQKFNSNKTSIFFSKNTKKEFRDHIASLVGHSAMTRYHNYLGLPTLGGRSKYKTFSGIRDRVSKRLDGWKVCFLSQAGKEVLLKAVVQAIPTYNMNVFRLPKSLCSQLNSLMSKFWWS